MKRTIFCQCLALLLIGLMLWAGQNATVLAQSRRQPPTSDEKKNKRPGQEKPAEKEQEPLPTDKLSKTPWPQTAQKPAPVLTTSPALET